METIEAALARNTEPKRHRNGGGFANLDGALAYDRKTLVMFCEFNHGLTELQATENLKTRRKMVGPLTKVGGGGNQSIRSAL